MRRYKVFENVTRNGALLWRDYRGCMFVDPEWSDEVLVRNVFDFVDEEPYTEPLDGWSVLGRCGDLELTLRPPWGGSAYTLELDEESSDV